MSGTTKDSASSSTPSGTSTTTKDTAALQMGAAPATAPAPAVQLATPQYLPGTLPIYILKQDGEAGAAAAAAAAAIKPPGPPQLAVANVDDPTSLPYRAASVDPPGAFVPMPQNGAPAPAPATMTPTPTPAASTKSS